MKESISIAWKTVLDRFYCPETNLLYDYVTDVSEKSFEHLPTPEEIGRCCPNPRGWGTGMEDSAMNGGCLLEALITAYDLCGDNELKMLAENIAFGLMSLERNGYVARSISPNDRKSFYPESSRDQYTHYVYSLYAYWKSELSDKKVKSKIANSIVRIAEKCEREVTLENEFNLLRSDGKIGVAGKMWGELSAHEWLRLPMIYLCAYKVSENIRFKKLYETIIDEGIEKSFLPMITSKCYCYLQMQYSMRLIYDCDTNESVRNKLLSLMKRNAEFGNEKAIKNSTEYTKAEYREQLSYRFKKFDSIEPLTVTIEHGNEYYNTAQSEREDNPMFYPVRSVGEGAMIAALCPDFKISGELISAVLNMADALDYENQYSVYAPLLLSCAYIMCKEKP